MKTIIPLAAAHHRVSDMNICLTALFYNRKIFLFFEERLQVCQWEPILLVVLVKECNNQKQ